MRPSGRGGQQAVGRAGIEPATLGLRVGAWGGGFARLSEVRFRPRAFRRVTSAELGTHFGTRFVTGHDRRKKLTQVHSVNQPGLEPPKTDQAGAGSTIGERLDLASKHAA